MDFVHYLDYWLFTIINNLAGRWYCLDSGARLLMNDYFAPTIIAITLLALWFAGTNPARRLLNQRAVLLATLSAALANILLKIINLLYFRPRPFHVYEVNLLFYQPSDSSLPSNAAAFGFSVAAGVCFYQRRWGWALLILASIFGLSRVFGGVHYPLDILSGAILGCAAAYTIYRQKYLVNRLLELLISITLKLGLP